MVLGTTVQAAQVRMDFLSVRTPSVARDTLTLRIRVSVTVACADVCLSSGGFGPSALHRGSDGLLTLLRPSSGSHRPGASGGAASPFPRLRARAPGPQLGRADRTRQGWARACLLVRWTRGLAWAPLSRSRAPRGQDRAAPRGQPGRASLQAPGKRLGCCPGPAPSWFLSLGR